LNTQETQRDELVVAIPVPVEGHDPHEVVSSVSRSVLRSCFETLVDREHGFRAGLAEEWTPVEKGWRVRLRDGVVFHDGRPLDAAAVVESCRRFVDPGIKNIMAGALADVRLRELDAMTVLFETGQPSPALPLALGRVPIVGATRQGNARAFLAGTGPFRLKQFAPRAVELERFDEYWDGAPPVRGAEFRTVDDPADRVRAIGDGSVQLATNLHPGVSDADVAPGRLVRCTSMLSTGVMLNLAFEHLADTRVRRALNYAIDLDGLIATSLNGAATPLASAIGPGYFGHEPGLQPYPHDPDRARRLLREARAEGLALTIAEPQDRYPASSAALASIAADLERVGVACRIELLEWPAFVRGIADKSHQAFYMQISTMAAERLFANEFSSDVKGIGWHHYRNPRVDELVRAANLELDDARRESLLRETCVELHADPPWLFLYNQDDVYGLGSDVDDWEPLRNGFVDLSRASRR
jgi:peptide/nickel transport system substrate-binding protein